MLDFELHSAHVYLVSVAIVLTISVLPYPFLVTLYVITVTVMAQNFDGSSKYCLDMPLL